MASWTSSGLVILGSLAGVKEFDLSATSNISITVGSKDRSTAETESPDHQQRFQRSQSVNE
jgi:hypothetical protein